MSRKVDVAKLLEVNLETNYDQLKKLREVLKGDKVDPYLIKQLGDLTRSNTALAAEARKRESSVKKIVAQYDDEQRIALIKEFVLELTADRRAELREFLEGCEKPRSVL